MVQRELHAYGHRLRTASGSEVIAHAFAEWGLGALERLNGDFAVAIWDRARRELVLARDRFGARPLFVAELDGDLCFASEAKALLRHRQARRELDPLGVVESFATWSVLPDRSAFRGVRELAPAHYASIGLEGVREERRWWDIDFSEHKITRSRSEWEEELRELLIDATRLRLRADVPVATYLSGGLDSSAITGLAAELSSRRLPSFAIGFRDQRYDESVAQDRVARKLGTSLQRVVVDEPDIATLLPRAIELSEKPTLSTALAPLLRLSGAAREAGVKIVLSGEGADELFAGSDIFRESKVRRFWSRAPSSAIRPVLFSRLDASVARGLGRSGAVLAGFYRKDLGHVGDPLFSHRPRFANTSRFLSLFRPEFREAAAMEGDPADRVERMLPPGFAEFTPLGRAQYLEITTFFEQFLLQSQGDRMLMGHSIEGRFPFLDHRVAELAARIPDELRLNGLKEKYLLRRAVAPYLPPEIATQRKQRFRAPIARVFVGPGAPDYVAALLEPSRLQEAGIFDPDAISRLVLKCESAIERPVGAMDEMALVGAVSTMLLQELLVEEPRLASPATPDRVVVGDRVETAPESSAQTPTGDSSTYTYT